MTTADFHFEHYVGGRFTSTSAHADRQPVFNPATGACLGHMPHGNAALVDEAVAAARAAQDAWAALPAQERGGHLHRIAQAVRAHAPRLARLIAAEQGKVLPLAEMEVHFTADYLDYSAEWARRIEGEVITSDRPREHIFLFRRPLGVIAGILPWNFPLFMVARKMAPALVTGNTIVIKPSEETPYSAHALARLVDEAGLPAGVFNLVAGPGHGVGDALAGHGDVNMVSFTGSSEAGAAIMANAARHVTKVSLELGGKAPAIVLADADVDLAVAMLKASKSINSGQACNCTERVYVQRAVHAEFCDKLAAAVGSIRYGDPLGEQPVEMGPLIHRNSVARISRLVDDARTRGAEILTGGRVAELGAGCHYEPTVISRTTANMQILQQEIFGPVILVDAIDDLDEGIARANASEYGLSSSIFTRNLSAALHAIEQLKFGETYVNRENFEAIQGFHAGVRRSGIGGADGKHGLYEFTHTQVAYIQR